LKRLLLFAFLVCSLWGGEAGAEEGGGPIAGGGTSGDSFFVGIISPREDGGSDNVSTGDPNGPPPYKYTWVPGGVIGGADRAATPGSGSRAGCTRSS
jgi:hypothetical protein